MKFDCQSNIGLPLILLQPKTKPALLIIDQQRRDID